MPIECSPYGYHWELVHRESGEVVNSGFVRGLRKTDWPDPMKGFTYRYTELYAQTEDSMEQRALETAMGMRGYRGSPAEREDREAGLFVGGQCQWLAMGPDDTDYPVATITAIDVDSDGDPWFELEFGDGPDGHKPVRVERDDIRPLPT